LVGEIPNTHHRGKETGLCACASETAFDLSSSSLGADMALSIGLTQRRGGTSFRALLKCQIQIRTLPSRAPRHFLVAGHVMDGAAARRDDLALQQLRLGVLCRASAHNRFDGQPTGECERLFAGKRGKVLRGCRANLLLKRREPLAESIDAASFCLSASISRCCAAIC